METPSNNRIRGPDVCFDQELIERYGGRGPRYTSYPTAVQFHEGFTADDYRRYARASNSDGAARPLSLYVHIPFCSSLCYYCACNKVVTRNAARVDEYMRMLYAEIRMQAALFGEDRPVSQLHFGGGTPTYLDNAQLGHLVRELRRSFRLATDDEREFSIEVDPRSVDAESVPLLAELGFNRLSLGVQDFEPIVQKAINRVQTATDVAELLRQARHTGFKSVSFDLIYGLPHQSVGSFDKTLQQVIVMRPDRLAIYNYAHLPARFKGQRMIRDRDLPSPSEKLDILHHTIDRLSAAGYVYIGMDHFALPDDDLAIAQGDGTLQRNFQGYSTHCECDLVGLGVSSISHVGDSYAQNTTSTIAYEAAISAGRLAVNRGLEMDSDDRLRAAVIQRLMCYDELRFDDFERRYGCDFRATFGPELESMSGLARDRLVELDDGGIYVTPRGRLLLRSIAMVFDRYLGTAAGEQKFSRAI